MDKTIELEALVSHKTSELLLPGNDSTLDKLCTEAWQQARQQTTQLNVLETAGLIALGVATLGVSGYYAGKRLGLGSISGLQRMAESREYLNGFFKRGSSASPRAESNAFWSATGSTDEIYSTFKMGDLHGYHAARGFSDIAAPKQAARIVDAASKKTIDDYEKRDLAGRLDYIKTMLRQREEAIQVSHTKIQYYGEQMRKRVDQQFFEHLEQVLPGHKL